MVRVAAVATIAVVVLQGCSSASTDTTETTATVTTRPPATSIATTTTVTEPTSTTSSTSTTAASSTTTTTAPTTTSTTTAATTTTLPAVDLEGFVLRGDGLGIVRFGHPVDDAMAILTGQLGTPSNDVFPYPGESIFPGTYWRVVTWDIPRLEVYFMDWRPHEVLDTPVLGYWRTKTGTNGPTLATAEGVGPGTPWVDLVGAYGDRVVAAGPDDDECLYSWVFSIDRDAATDYFFHMRGDLDGDPANPATAISTIYAGVVMEGC